MRHDGEEAAELPNERKNDRKKTTTANEMKINRKRERNFRKGTVHAHAQRPARKDIKPHTSLQRYDGRRVVSHSFCGAQADG